MTDEQEVPGLSTGISEITGKLIRVSHASEADIAAIREAMERSGLDALDLDPDEFVVAYEDKELVGIGRVSKPGEIHELGCVVVTEDEKAEGVGRLIAQHLVEYASVDKIYVMADQAKYFRKIGFREADKSSESLELEIACATVEKANDKVLMVHPKGTVKD